MKERKFHRKISGRGYARLVGLLSLGLLLALFAFLKCYFTECFANKKRRMAHNHASLPDRSDINPTSRADPSKLNALNFVFLRVEFSKLRAVETAPATTFGPQAKNITPLSPMVGIHFGGLLGAAHLGNSVLVEPHCTRPFCTINWRNCQPPKPTHDW